MENKKNLEQLNKIIEACKDRIQEEISTLLGKKFQIASHKEPKVSSKGQLFEQLEGKSVLAHIQLEGELEGKGCVLVSLADAIRIGGTLIMLPESELEAVLSEEKYTEELEDSYGEVANIFCGSLTYTFEEHYPKSFRIVRTEQEIVLPLEVDIDSGEPVPVGSYYTCSFLMNLEGREMGELKVVLPAAPFGLAEETAFQDDSQKKDESSQAVKENGEETTTSVKQTVAEREKVKKTEAEILEQQEGKDKASEKEPAPVAVKKKDINKQKKIVDTLLQNAQEKIAEEIGILTGGTLSISNPEEQIYTKKDFLEQAGGKQALARMAVRGDADGEVFLFVPIAAAIHLGGTLIMLPESELKETVRKELFGEESADAFGEIANIIAGVYTLVFEEQYRKNYGFVKTTVETIVPVKIDPDSDDTLPNQLYYLSAYDISYNGEELGRVQIIFPASLLELEGLLASDDPEPAQQPTLANDKISTSDEALAGEVQVGGKAFGQAVSALGQSSGSDGADIIVFSDDLTENERLGVFFEELGYTYQMLPFKSSVNDYLTNAVQLVFLIMKNVNEQGFGVAIKISSSGYNVPLILAGPAWTRSLVIKAVKYGAGDILITPATREDLREKIELNLPRKAA
ncbi:MAG: hypothetical protein CSA32_02755 [Desulfobulbus propionicus]|nr:MAG: hypothetical protein CSA32_02755 [Desulfobulbus propionicus]